MGKLVRDNIPDIIERSEGKKPKIRTLGAKSYQQALLTKLVEEASEAASAKNKKDLVMELADVEEVLATIRWAFGIAKPVITKIQNKKRKERGGFIKRIFLVD